MNALLVLLIAALLSAAQERPVIPLPSDPTAIVIAMDWRATYSVGPRKNMNPVLTIRANGRVTVIDPSGRTADKETVLSPAEVQELLYFAVTQQDFFAFKATDVDRDIQTEVTRAGAGMRVFDYSDTVMRVKTADKEQEAVYNALSVWAGQYPSIKMLQQLRAIEVRLTKLIEEVRAGPK